MSGVSDRPDSLRPPPSVDVDAFRARLVSAYGVGAWGGLSPRASAALQLLAARLAGGGSEETLTPVDVGDALAIVDELYRADREWLANLDAWVASIQSPGAPLLLPDEESTE